MNASRTVAGHEPHPLHRPERLRRRNGVDCSRPGADRRSRHALAGVREHRRHANATLPVAGGVANTDTLLGHDGFVGVKTGSDGAAGRCFAFRAVRWIGDKSTTITGVVLGQPGQDRIAASLAAAEAMVDRIAGDRPTRIRDSELCRQLRRLEAVDHAPCRWTPTLDGSEG